MKVFSLLEFWSQTSAPNYYSFGLEISERQLFFPAKKRITILNIQYYSRYWLPIDKTGTCLRIRVYLYSRYSSILEEPVI